MGEKKCVLEHAKISNELKTMFRDILVVISV